jgi:hypothetical protein
MPNSFIYNFEYANIGHSIYSDHSPVQLKLKELTTNNKGTEYVTKINKLIVNPTESENIEFFHEMRSICTLVTPALTPH